MKSRHCLMGFMDELTAHWPSLPFMAFGLWGAWSSLTYSGALWLSDNEVNGYYLSLMYIISGFACAAVFLAAAFWARRGGETLVASNRAVMLGGLISGVGCLLIIAVGPYYLGAIFGSGLPLFTIGALGSGVGTALIGLRCGALFGLIPPRRTLIYAGLSQLLCAFIYFVIMESPTWAPVPHGPSLVNILTFGLLPIAAAGLSCVRPPRAAGLIELHGIERHEASLRRLPRAFWGFTAFVFVIALVTAMLRADVVTTHALASTVEGNGLLMLLRILMALGFMVYAVHSTAQAHGIGKLCTMLTVISATATACVAALGGLSNELSLLVYFCAGIFDFLVWCLLAFIAVQRRISAVVVFGVGRGVFMLGCTLGWLVGTLALPSLPSGTPTTVFFFVLAGVLLVFSLVFFSERDYMRLFMPLSEEEPSLEDLFDIERREKELAERQQAAQKRGRFSVAVEGLAQEYGLSSRESEVLRCLAMGYGSDRIAETMGVKVNTARAHTHNVYVKLDVHSRDELMKLVDETVAQV